MSLDPRLIPSRALLIFALFVFPQSAVAKPPPPASLPPLPMLPSVARVKVTSHGSAISVVQEVNLPRGDWKGEALSFHIAFGAPGPRAIDVHLVSVGDGSLEPDDDDVGELLPAERVPRRPANAHALVGRETMAGIVVQVPPASFTKALARGNMAALRIRSVVEATGPDASGASSVVVRLGSARSAPLTLGRIVATSIAPAPPLAHVEARLCGQDADPHPLAVRMVPKPAQSEASEGEGSSTGGARTPQNEPAIAPVLAVRHATDDLCVRLWHREK